jgi:anti-anti-sigma factor
VTEVALGAVHTMLVYDVRGGRPHSTVARWIVGAAARREKILYELAPGEDPDLVLRSARFRLGQDLTASGRLELLDAAGLRAESGGGADGLHDVHRARLRQARGQGWAGLAVVTGGAVLTAVADREPAGLVHERGVARLVAEHGISALCCHHTGEAPNLLDAMLAVHVTVDDVLWGADLVGERLRLRGEIDASNADRVVPVLSGAIAAGVRVVDLATLTFCSAAGVRAIVAAANTLQPGDVLVLVDPNPSLRLIFHLVGLVDHDAVSIVEENPR